MHPTPLHWMAKKGAPLDVVKSFLEMYPEAKNIKCNNGGTPLQLAKECGECSAEVVSILEQDETNEKKDDDEEKKEK